MTEPVTREQALAILDLPMGENDAQAATVREYLYKLLDSVWELGEGFDGKRPFGDSNWEFELYTVLGRAGLVPMTFDADGYIETFDAEDEANHLIHRAIWYMCGMDRAA